MSNRLRRQFTGRQKTEILKRHLLDRVAVSIFATNTKSSRHSFMLGKSSFLRRVKKPLSAALIPSKLQPLYRTNASPTRSQACSKERSRCRTS